MIETAKHPTSTVTRAGLNANYRFILGLFVARQRVHKLIEKP
jgi:hypothetical protein